MKLGHSNTVLPALKKSLLLDHQNLINYFNDLKANEKRQVMIENYLY
jgi:hypothetical protein